MWRRRSCLPRPDSSGRLARVETVLLLCLAILPCRAAEDLPPWLKDAAARPTPASAEKSSAVVLDDEQSQTIDETARIVTTTRYAIRILAADAKGAATARAIYLTDSGKVRELRAWLIQPSGTVKHYGKDKTLDIALVNNDIYNEVRAKVISAGGDADPGAVFAYESISEERAMFLQSEWSFRGRYPVILSRYSAALPAGWRAEAIALAGHPPEPAATGTAYTWEMRDLHASGPAPRLAVNFIPAEGTRTGGAVGFTSWSAVSRWLADLAAPQAVPDDAIAAKARALAAGAESEFARIQKIGQFAQSINYISIQTGLHRGGGYRPHAASLVFAKSYGDCKDKANLMRAMLKAIDIEAFPVAIYSGNRTHVRPDWPSPEQFNHMIIAIKVSDETQAAAILQHPSLGRLLLFDPTDPDTGAGYLPEHEQGSYALIVAGDAGDLVKMPVAAVSADRQERRTDIVLNPNGDITAVLEERSTGEAAARELRLFHHASAASYKRAIEQWIVRGVKAAAVSKIEPAEAGSEFRLTVEFSAPRYAQSMQGRILVFQPAIVGRRESLPLGDTGHTVPLVSQAYDETVRVKLPPGFKVDEIPPRVDLDTPFGKYSLACGASAAELTLHRSLEMRAGTVSAKDNAALHAFYKKIMDAEQAPVVLVKQ